MTGADGKVGTEDTTGPGTGAVPGVAAGAVPPRSSLKKLPWRAASLKVRT